MQRHVHACLSNYISIYMQNPAVSVILVSGISELPLTNVNYSRRISETSLHVFFVPSSIASQNVFLHFHLCIWQTRLSSAVPNKINALMLIFKELM